MPLDSDSIGYLDDVKKGKPRRFVMICKGVRIMSLVVYKKGTVERYKKQAKEEGKGQFYHGVVDGKGLSIAFKLCRADGYEKPPGKELILKDYLSTETGIRFKPEYQIVDVLPEVHEHDESEGTEAEGEEQKTPPPAPPMPEAGTYTATDLAAECKQLKATLYPQVKEAIAAHPDQKDAIIRLFASADKNEKATEFAKAIEDYRKLSSVLASLSEAEEKEEEGESTDDPAVLFNERLKALLTDLKAAAGSAAADEAKLKISEAGVFARKKDFAGGNALLEQAHEILNDWAAENYSNFDPTVLFNERLKALLPNVKAAAGTLAGDEAKRLVGEAGGFARKKDFGEANSLLDEATDILEMHGGEDAKTDVDPAVSFNERLKAFLPEVKAAAGTQGGDAAKLKVSEAGVLARKKDFAGANALLDEAEEALDETGEPSDLSDIAPGIVQKRKFLLERWRRIPEEISADLKELQKGIEAQAPDEDADLLIELSEDYLKDFYGEMKEAIDDDINLGDPQYKKAISAIQSFRAKIDTEPLVQHLKQADIAVDSILLNALDEVEQALAS